MPQMNATGEPVDYYVSMSGGRSSIHHCINCGYWYTGYHDCSGATLAPYAGPALWPQTVPVWPQPERKPHVCPVCTGTGKVQTSSAAADTGGDTCPACAGACVLWG